ncbi:MAG TPA: GyrI-like domain-containing protein [Herbaspirillum sp.]|jgi:AraC family transcriptional regulator
MAIHTLAQVRIADFEATRVGAFTYRGDVCKIADAIGQFIAWRKENHLPPARHATFNICHDMLNAAHGKGEVYLDICAATEGEIGVNRFGVIEKTIPGGRCAVLRHVGSEAGLGAAVAFLYTEWLPQSGEALRDFPLFLQRVHFFPEVPEDRTVIDIFLPLRPAA